MWEIFNIIYRDYPMDDCNNNTSYSRLLLGRFYQ